MALDIFSSILTLFFFLTNFVRSLQVSRKYSDALSTKLNFGENSNSSSLSFSSDKSGSVVIIIPAQQTDRLNQRPWSNQHTCGRTP
uniref:Putative secreted protein n=1 Tax=Ixodes ricinus TaxID=34613 RepID=A0A6B0TYM7_IXORI